MRTTNNCACYWILHFLRKGRFNLLWAGWLNLITHIIIATQHGNSVYGIYALVGLYQKSHSFAALTRSISDTYQLVRKYHTDKLSMKYSIFLYAACTYHVSRHPFDHFSNSHKIFTLIINATQLRFLKASFSAKNVELSAVLSLSPLIACILIYLMMSFRLSYFRGMALPY